MNKIRYFFKKCVLTFLIKNVSTFLQLNNIISPSLVLVAVPFRRKITTTSRHRVIGLLREHMFRHVGCFRYSVSLISVQYSPTTKTRPVDLCAEQSNACGFVAQEPVQILACLSRGKLTCCERGVCAARGKISFRPSTL